MMARVEFMNIEIDNLLMEEVLFEIEKLIKLERNAYVVTPNVDHIVQLQYDNVLKEIYKSANLILADGMPLIWISKLYRKPIKQKISGSDLFPLLCELSAKKGYKMFFLGAAEGVANIAAEKLMKKYDKLNVVGVYSPPIGFEKNSTEVNKIKDIINDAKPDILIVGLGAPKQEKFIYQNRMELNVSLSLGLGASLDFEAGKVKRAPKWMREYGLEWFYRFLQEPRRMFKRYFIDDLKILGLIFKYRNGY